MLSFSERLAQKSPLLLDGATGTELENRGVETSSPIWSAMALKDAPQLIEQIHFEYVNSGAEIITANTFRTHQRSLDKVGLGHQALSLTRKAIELARSAIERSGKHAYVAGSVAPLEDCYVPELVPSDEDLFLEHSLMAENLAAAKVDLLLIETMNTIREAVAAARAARHSGLPFGVSFVCGDDGRLLSGESVGKASLALEALGPAFLGINCIPASTLEHPLSSLAQATDLPLAAYGNIGQSHHFKAWRHSDDFSPVEFAQICELWLGHKVKIIGGCCGTSPDHIAALHSSIRKETS